MKSSAAGLLGSAQRQKIKGRKPCRQSLWQKVETKGQGNNQ